MKKYTKTKIHKTDNMAVAKRINAKKTQNKFLNKT